MPAARQLLAALLVAALVAQAPGARADNPMGYRLLTQSDAQRLPRNHGVLGLDVARGGAISDAGLDFEILQVKSVKSKSPAQQAGIRPGDNIIAVDGQVFPSIASFAAYIGSLSPGTEAAFDVIPAGGGPGQAERVSVRIGPNDTGMSTGTKVAIGVGAAALLGCYELGCFSHRRPAGQVQQTR